MGSRSPAPSRTAVLLQNLSEAAHVGGEAEKPCLPGTEPKLTASAKPQVQNTSNYPCFSSVRAPLSLCLGNRDSTASFHPAFVCLIPFFGAGVAFQPVLVGCLAERSSPSCSLPIVAIVLQIIAVIAMQW